jgi:hypothetical protein
MSFDTCPTDVAAAPAERIWERLIDPSRLDWVDARLLEAPARRLQAGDRLLFAASLGLRVSWLVKAIEPLRELTLDIGLPFGMSNLETIVLSPIDGAHCRVTFN